MPLACLALAREVGSFALISCPLSRVRQGVLDQQQLSGSTVGLSHTRLLHVRQRVGCVADGTEQQAEISRIAAEDAFNWGYDPVHYGVPEGSYATNPDDGSRIVEYRHMVKVLSQLPAARPALRCCPKPACAS